MPLFVMIGWDSLEGASRRDQHREKHVAHISALDDEGRISFAGPIRDDDGQASVGVVIAFEADDLADARQVVASDPYVTGGVFKTYTVNPFKKVFPKSP